MIPSVAESDYPLLAEKAALQFQNPSTALTPKNSLRCRVVTSLILYWVQPFELALLLQMYYGIGGTVNFEAKNESCLVYVCVELFEQKILSNRSIVIPGQLILLHHQRWAKTAWLTPRTGTTKNWGLDDWFSTSPTKRWRWRSWRARTPATTGRPHAPFRRIQQWSERPQRPGWLTHINERHLLGLHHIFLGYLAQAFICAIPCLRTRWVRSLNCPRTMQSR